MSGRKILSARMRIVKYHNRDQNGRLCTARFKSDKGLENFLQYRKDSIKVVEIIK